VLAEFAFTLLLDAISAVAKTAAMLRLAFGTATHWVPHNRNDHGVGWSEAIRLLWPQTMLGILVFALFAHAGWTATLWALPLAGGLLLAIPFCVLTANTAVSRWLRENAVAAIPEEIVTQSSHAPVPALAMQAPADSD
jgi:membrane glycosyltransferase